MSEPIAIPVEIAAQENVSFSPQDDGMISDNSNHLSYKATHGVPYIIDYLGLREFYNASEPVTQLARQLHTILVQDDNEETIDQTKIKLDELAQELNLSEDDSGIYKLKKMLALATARDRIRQLEIEKQHALAYSEML